MEKSAFEIKKYICREEKINSHFTVDKKKKKTIVMMNQKKKIDDYTVLDLSLFSN